MSESIVITSALANELRTLCAITARQPQPLEALLSILNEYGYFPEEYSDSENQVIWCCLIRLALHYGVTRTEFQDQLGVVAFMLQQWENGVSLPQRIEMRKDLYLGIMELLFAKQ